MFMPDNQKFRKIYMVLLLLGLLALSSCGSLKPDVKMYDFVYASGYSRDSYTRDETVPVIGSQLTVNQTNGQLADLGGNLLYTLSGLLPEDSSKGISTVRGETASRGVIICSGGIFLPYNEETNEGAIWLCSETWAKSPYNGFVDGTLQGGRVLLVDSQSGQTVFSGETKPGELFLTASGNRCYFYYPGKMARRREDVCPAQIYWRDINSWLLSHSVYTFDYVSTPEVDGQEMERLRFYPEAGEGTLRLDFTCYEQTNAENDRWDYVVKKSVEVPLTAPPESEQS